MSNKIEPCFFAARIADLVYTHLPDEAIERLRGLLECTTIEALRSAVAELKERSAIDRGAGDEQAEA